MEDFDKYEKALYYEIFIKEEYEKAKESIIKGNTIFDIGSHIGLFTERCLSLNPQGEIFCFEPVEILYKKMVARLSQKFPKSKIHTFNQGIGIKEQQETMFLNKTKTMQSSKYHSFLNQNGEATTVKFITMEQIIHQYQIQNIDLVKMDIEGMEFEVLSSRQTSTFQKIQNIIIEIHLLDKTKEQQYQQLLEKIQQHFPTIHIQKSEYNQKILLLFATKR